MKWILIVGLALPLPVFAATNGISVAPSSWHHSVSLSQTLDALYLPSPNAIRALSAQGVTGYHNLTHLAFAENQPVEVQWKSLMMLSILGGPLSLPQLERAASSRQWYMRNAALVGMAKVSHERAVHWARHLLIDPSLIVRTSAVQTLKQLHDEQSADLLWSQLYNRQNFRLSQSLWIRRHIVEALAEFARKGDESRFVAVLSDADSTLYPAAIEGLENATGQKLGPTQDSIAAKRQQWQQWWQVRLAHGQ